MAYLNVRERRVETKITYVGTGGVGIATNLEQIALRATPRPRSVARELADDTGEVLSVEWSAPPEVQYRDCGLTVRVVAGRGAVSVERTRALVRDADGVVLVLDSSPEARERNRTSAALLCDALASQRSTVPVVVQVNKSDLPGADEAAAVVAALEGIGGHWPHVAAAAIQGRGVVETLERAIEDVLAALKAQADDEAQPAPPPVTPRGEGNPLLAALRLVLRDTVQEHVAELAARMDRTMAEDRARRAAEVQAFEGALEKMNEATRDAARRFERTERALGEMGTTLAAIERLTSRDRPADVAIPELEGALGNLAARVEAAHELQKVAEQELRAELARGHEARARGDRDAVTHASSQRRALESLVAEVKQGDPRQQLGEISAQIAGLRSLLEPALTASRTGEKNVLRDLRELRDRVAHVEDVVRHGASASQEAHVRGEQARAELHGKLAELVDEIQKRDKKRWFT
jgi:hypothetical protein